MPNGNNRFDGHERFRELAALANSGTLSANEWLELKHHLRICQDCREIHNQYQLLNDVGMPFLAAAYGDLPELEHLDDSFAREKLLARIEAEVPPSDALVIPAHRTTPPHLLSNLAANQWMRVGLAACLGIAVALGAYEAGSRTRNGEDQKLSSSQQQTQKLTAEKQTNDQLVARPQESLRFRNRTQGKSRKSADYEPICERWKIAPGNSERQTTKPRRNCERS